MEALIEDVKLDGRHVENYLTMLDEGRRYAA